MIRVHLAGEGAEAQDRSYDILCGRGLLAEVGPAIRQAGARRAVVIADAAVQETHAAAVAKSLRSAGLETETIAVASGETSKSLESAGRIWSHLARLAVDRATHVVAVGGGVVGDLSGFVAATFARGLSVWHVPTTLVAQVDSAIGGKTGINLAEGKNLVGAFWQPRGVFADIDALATLPDREFVSGLAEIVKYGMILDAQFFTWLEANAAGLLARDPERTAFAVHRSAALKARVVGQDEREISGLRAALNYGHTFGHAYETAAGYGTLLHGEAVAIGMSRAARLAALLGRIDAEVVGRQDALLARLSLPIAAQAAGSIAPERLLEIMARDKKSLGGRLRFVLPDRIGRAELVADIDPVLVRTALIAT
ncbi:MAG: 3-dehydroquinate synthase [Planctomycetes bacterium]|nr:3-dehydroquinate synthase [Planctomycetota bacterium]